MNGRKERNISEEKGKIREPSTPAKAKDTKPQACMNKNLRKKIYNMNIFNDSID